MLCKLMTGLGACAVLAMAASADAGLPAIKAEFVGTATAPTYLTHAPGDDANRLFIIERGGIIRILEDGKLLAPPFLNISTQVFTGFEGGLVGLAFHPDYQTNGYFYVHYTPPAANGLDSVIARFQVTTDPNIADEASEQVVLRIDQPDPRHNGAWIGFGPFDGHLYVPIGDGGFAGNPFDRAQDIDLLFGKVLRLDVNGDDFPADPNRNYAIPPDNPFVDAPGADEIWAVGMRNPYRGSFDEIGNLWLGDVGQADWEELDVLLASAPVPVNFGWGCMEGPVCFGAACQCGDPSITVPEFFYSHADGHAITAGAVYRGCAIPELAGTFFVGDYGNGRIWALTQEDGDVTAAVEVTDQLQPIKGRTISRIVAIAEDSQGELYIVSIDGVISKIVPETPISPDPCNPCPADLDGSGAVGFADLSTLLAAWGVCGACPEDFDGDGQVGFADLSTLLAQWGPC